MGFLEILGVFAIYLVSAVIGMAGAYWFVYVLNIK